MRRQEAIVMQYVNKKQHSDEFEPLFWDSYVLMRLYVLMLLGVLVTGLHGQHQVNTEAVCL